MCTTFNILLVTTTYIAVFTGYPQPFPSGDSTHFGLSAMGITGRVLLILTGVITLLVWVVMLTTVSYMLLG